MVSFRAIQSSVLLVVDAAVSASCYLGSFPEYAKAYQDAKQGALQKIQVNMFLAQATPAPMTSY